MSEPTVDTSEVAGDLARRKEGDRGPSIFDLIRAQEPAIQRALPKVGVDAARFARIVQTEIRKSPKLASCTPASLLGAMMLSAQLGLEFGPLGLAWMVPYGKECTFVLGYKGMLELARRSGEIVQLEAREIRDHDDFSFELGDSPHVHHTWDVRKPRGEVVAYYGLAVFKSGGKFILPVSLEEIEKRRNRSRAKDSGPWSTDYEAMARKSVLRMMAPWLPLTTEVAEAFAHDEAVRVFNPDATPEEAIEVREVLPPETETEGEAADAASSAPGAPPVEPTPDPSVPGPDDASIRAGSRDAEGSPNATGYAAWTKVWLEDECKARDLTWSGKNKAELVVLLASDDLFNERHDLKVPSEKPFESDWRDRAEYR